MNHCKTCSNRGIVTERLDNLSKRIKDGYRQSAKDAYDCYCECQAGRRQEWVARRTAKQVTKTLADMTSIIPS